MNDKDVVPAFDYSGYSQNTLSTKVCTRMFAKRNVCIAENFLRGKKW
jgi:hypothetical protein